MPEYLASVTDQDQVSNWRQRRLNVHLATLRDAVRGMELDSRDHAVLTKLADQDAAAVGSIARLLTRARQTGAE